MPEPVDGRIGDIVAALREACAPRAKSLIVSVIGDSLAPHGGTVWLSSLIDLARPLGLNERLVRTAARRLVRDDWLHATQIGRRSAYSVTEAGRNRSDDVHNRIYGASRLPWDGRWRFVFTGLGRADPAQREKLRRELLWLGYGAVAPNVFAHPSTNFAELRPAVKALGLEDDIVTMTADAATSSGGDLARTADDLLRKSWDLGKLSAAYALFTERFAPVRDALSGGAPGAETCFVLRTLLIHEYRRVRLRDPELPAELMPRRWEGAAAHDLCRALYRAVQAGAERHLRQTVKTPTGPLPPAAPHYYERFGGLPRPAAPRRRSAARPPTPSPA